MGWDPRGESSTTKAGAGPDVAGGVWGGPARADAGNVGPARLWPVPPKGEEGGRVQNLEALPG